MKKLYVALRALPWAKLSVTLGKTPDGKVHSIQASGDSVHAGFLPVYWDEESAKRENPGAEIKEGAVGDDWGIPNNPQGAQGVALFGEDLAKLDKKGLLDLARLTEDKLDLTIVAAAREKILGGGQLNGRHGEEKIRKYLAALKDSQPQAK